LSADWNIPHFRYLASGLHPRQLRNRRRTENQHSNGAIKLVSEFPQELVVGEDEFIGKVSSGIQPMFGIWEKRRSECFDSIGTMVPNNVPKSLRDAVASIAALIKVEAQFNSQKVGGTVNVGLIDRVARKTYSIIL
jgi:hypothetical protein